jgi:2-amino-4-hydroxy-6-hydroxymethyldihydropteridine diphosphokinase
MREGGVIAYVAIGANLGDREATFAAVIRSLEDEPDLLLLAASPVFETGPVGPAEQGDYLNAVLQLRAWVSPIELLHRLQEIETRLGRDRQRERQRWGPRAIDLDLVFFGDRCIESIELVLPHPRAHERAFVMAPMAELDPGFVHPTLGVTVAEIALGRLAPAELRAWRRPPGWPGADREDARLGRYT